jgi:hypothetical protein
VCKAGVGSNSINCTACGKWVSLLKRCSGLTGSLNVVEFECSSVRVHGNTREAAEVKKEMKLDGDRNVECVDEFCYLEDMMGSGGGAEEASRVQCAWAKFRELSPLLTAKGASLKVKGKLYSLYPVCYDVWQRNLGYESRGYAVSGEGGEDQVDVRSDVEGWTNK